MGPVEPSVWKPTAVWAVYGKWVASTSLRSLWAAMEPTRIRSRVSCVSFSIVETDEFWGKRNLCSPRGESTEMMLCQDVWAIDGLQQISRDVVCNPCLQRWGVV